MIAGFLASALLAASPAPAAAVLRAGTPVRLVTSSEISSKTHKEGDRVALSVAEDVKADGHVVIPRGAEAAAEVTRRLPKGAYGKSGKLEIRLLYVMAGGRQIRIDGEVAQKGQGNVLPAAAAGVVTLAVAFFVNGKSATIPAGAQITGYVHRDLPLKLAE